MKKSLIILFILLSLPTYAGVPMNTAEQIYKRVVAANHFYVHPNLRFVQQIWTKKGWSDNNANTGIPWQNINMTYGLLARANEAQVAFVLGHELGHFRLMHMGSTIAHEYAADKLGFKYAVKAGYNGCAGASYLRGKPGSDDHPPGNDRLKALGCM